MPLRKSACKWVNDDKEFIEILKKYELSNAFHGYTLDNPIWQKISAEASLTAGYCRRKWLSIKYAYIKLQHMIRIGKVTESMVRSNRRTSKFMDGRLAFLDRFLSEIPDNALPKSVHDFFDSVFECQKDKSTHSVDAVKLIKLKKQGGIIEVIQDYDQETGTEPTCILPNTEQPIEVASNDENSNDVELVTPVPVHQGILPAIDMANFQHASSSSMQPITNDPINDLANIQKVRTIKRNPKKNAEIEYIIKRIEPKKSKKDLTTNTSKLKQNVGGCKLANFLVKYSNTNIETDQNDLKEYMDDLAELLCNRLAPSKRKYFLSQIDLIVSEMLEGQPC
ncbi:hypothetical protein PYW08_001702 [Mythimna loreyi]|uniref:Uncharacterized protein n=1 Tax=Mythimna loreyi TaxID=667449 RepID=A0ACC2R789_9NEOP|nr:hypothetical protein PYW08_001702 [Mythimna loreyi]